MNLVMPDVALVADTNAQVRKTVLVSEASAQESAVMATECPVCEEVLEQGATHREGCAIDFVAKFNDSDVEIKALQTTLRARQQSRSSYSVDAWAAIQWRAVAPGEALVLRIVVLARTNKRKMR